jgi:alpha-galactosidase
LLKRLLISCTLAAALAALARPAAAQPPIVASLDDAFIAHDPSSDLWTIGSAGLELAVGFGADHLLGFQALSDPVSGKTLNITPGADLTLTANGTAVRLGTSSPMRLVSVQPSADDRGVRLVFTFEHTQLHARFVRGYACYPGSPTIETWTRIEPLVVAAVAISDPMAWQITMPVNTVRWLGGLRGDTADNLKAGAFELSTRDLDVGDHLEIGSQGRSTEQDVPFVIVGAGVDDFYGGIMWSGGWRIAFDRLNDTDLRVSALFPGLTTMVYPGHPVELPHAFFGLSTRSGGDESGAMHQFILNGIRHGRPFQPLVTYNTWFAYGTTIDQDQLTDEMGRAAAMGVELFVVDAGWYVGAGANGDQDFDSGLGTWTEDAARFPDGLSALAQNAHGANMKFGIWVEPERVSLAKIDRPGLAVEPWLATRDGSYGSSTSAQICLVHPAARKWVMDHLIALIDATHADYLKWDNNFWINCNRIGHGHGKDDGNFAHVQALYGILTELRQRYPDLLIENVSGGGNRLDFGMVAFTDTAWMDDRTSPSDHVRHNLEGLTFAFPPAYLLSFLIDSEAEPIRGGSDLQFLIRSRMMGILGLTYRTVDFDETLTDGISAGIANYKTIRDIVANADATLLSDQAPVAEDAWEVLQELADGGRSAVILAYKGSDSAGRLVVRPRQLLAGATYDVQSVDAGALGSATGAQLMSDGIEVDHAGGSRGHILILTTSAASASKVRRPPH